MRAKGGWARDSRTPPRRGSLPSQEVGRCLMKGRWSPAIGGDDGREWLPRGVCCSLRRRTGTAPGGTVRLGVGKAGVRSCPVLGTLREEPVRRDPAWRPGMREERAERGACRVSPKKAGSILAPRSGGRRSLSPLFRTKRREPCFLSGNLLRKTSVTSPFLSDEPFQRCGPASCPSPAPGRSAVPQRWGSAERAPAGARARPPL